MSSSFQTTTHGKWILAGEHAVIRGHGALVFPLVDKTLQLSYDDTSGDLILNAQMSDQNPQDMRSLLQQILEHAMRLLGRTYDSLRGTLSIFSNIPVGVGMGASAALCVALARWFVAQQWIKNHEEYGVARELEHVFHGQSSGLDIAGVMSTLGIYFQNGSSIPLEMTWMPNWRLSTCGQKGPTAECIRKVQELWKSNPVEAQALDVKMQDSVLLAKQALITHDAPQERQNSLAKSIQQAGDCFKRWGLVTDHLQEHMDDLYHQGALAVKPTGSGGGGYVLSLWE